MYAPFLKICSHLCYSFKLREGKNKDDLKNEDNLKHEDYIKKEDTLKNQDCNRPELTQP